MEQGWSVEAVAASVFLRGHDGGVSHPCSTLSLSSASQGRALPEVQVLLSRSHVVTFTQPCLPGVSQTLLQGPA